MNEIKSPIDIEYNATKVGAISTNEIIALYKKDFKIDVSKYFLGLDEIFIYKCSKTGYNFYFPYELQGDDLLYSELQKLSWYYDPWKWEHTEAIKHIDSNDRILEIGCGTGGFLEKLKSSNISYCGLELNKKAIKEAQSKGLRVYDELVNDHAKKFSEYYDVVCSFQVLEHIFEVREFIADQLKCLKKGGRLIISVPNNDSYLKYQKNSLNMPPHHMGLWNEESLKNLGKVFDLRFDNVIYEPAVGNRKKSFVATMANLYRAKHYVPKFLTKNLINLFISVYPKELRGFTIQIHFIKK